MKRKNFLQAVTAATTAFTLLPLTSCITKNRGDNTVFAYCLTTRTIRGQGLSLTESIEIAAKAGYDGVELWINDIRKYISGDGFNRVTENKKSGSILPH